VISTDRKVRWAAAADAGAAVEAAAASKATDGLGVSCWVLFARSRDD
jgi:hypothetical protein